MKKLENEIKNIMLTKTMNGPIHFFTQHNRKGTIFRADPEFSKDPKEVWYDWVLVNWGEKGITDRVPAKLLLFMEITELDFIKKINMFGDSSINYPGTYAIAYSFESNNTIAAHLESKLVTFGKLHLSKDDFEPIIYVFDVNCIVDTVIAVPYVPTEDVIDAKEWIILKSRSEWYETFISHLKAESKK
jgi:hypothetical protein